MVFKNQGLFLSHCKKAVAGLVQLFDNVFVTFLFFPLRWLYIIAILEGIISEFKALRWGVWAAPVMLISYVRKRILSQNPALASCVCLPDHSCVSTSCWRGWHIWSTCSAKWGREGWRWYLICCLLVTSTWPSLQSSYTMFSSSQKTSYSFSQSSASLLP